MNKSLFSGFWEKISKIILKNRVLIVLSLLTATYFFTTHWDNIRFTYTEANLLPATHPENIKYQSFTDKFGEEGNLIVISVKDSTLFTIEKLNAWNELSHSFKDHEDVSTVIAFGDLQKLKKE
jgi:predicted RND superfamily exporter protein